MNSSLFSDELNRRRFVSLAAKSFLGVSILPWASHSSLNGAGLGLNRPLNHAPKAKNVKGPAEEKSSLPSSKVEKAPSLTKGIAAENGQDEKKTMNKEKLMKVKRKRKLKMKEKELRSKLNLEKS